MPDVKISAFPTAPSFNAADLTTGLQGGVNVNFSGTLIETFIGRVGGPLALALAAKAPLASPNFTGTVTGITKAMVGLGNVDNTSDADKPISTAQAAVNAAKANIASPTFTGVPAGPTAAPGTTTTQLATTAYVMAAVAAGTAGVASFNTRVGAVVPLAGDYNKTMVGLDQVDNTSDVNKPISTAQAAVNTAKANLASPAFTGTPTAPTAAPGTNTTQVATTAFVTAAVAAGGGGGGGVASFNTRTGAVVPLAGDYTPTMVGLGNVNNTSDAAKPVSTAQQTALDGKANLAQAISIPNAYTLLATDDGNILFANSGSATVITVPVGLRVGFTCQIWRAGGGAVSINSSGGGVIVLESQSRYTLARQYSGCVLSHVLGGNQYFLQGDLVV